MLKKLKKLFFTALLPETLVFRLCCQELKELNQQRLVLVQTFKRAHS